MAIREFIPASAHTPGPVTPGDPPPQPPGQTPPPPDGPQPTQAILDRAIPDQAVFDDPERVVDALLRDAFMHEEVP